MVEREGRRGAGGEEERQVRVEGQICLSGFLGSGNVLEAMDVEDFGAKFTGVVGRGTGWLG